MTRGRRKLEEEKEVNLDSISCPNVPTTFQCVYVCVRMRVCVCMCGSSIIQRCPLSGVYDVFISSFDAVWKRGNRSKRRVSDAENPPLNLLPTTCVHVTVL